MAKSERFLTAARWGYSNGDVDTCASRAYYSVHHACLALLLLNGANPSIEEASKPKIFTDFARLARQRYARIAAMRYSIRARSLQQSLETLSELREEADYRVPGIEQQAARYALEFAERLVMAARESLS